MTLATANDENLQSLGKKMTDFSDDLAYTVEDTKIKATGTLKNIKDFKAFNESDPSEQNGYYLPFTATPKEPETEVKISVDGKPDVGPTPDNTFVVFLGTDEAGKSKNIAVKAGEDTSTIDMSALVLGQ